MDLQRVRRFDYQLKEFFTDRDIGALENRRMVTLVLFDDITKSILDVLHIPGEGTVSFFIGNFQEQDDRIFYHFKANLSNGVTLDKCFWNYAKIPFMRFQDLLSWQEPRVISIKLDIGIYEGNGSVWEWQNMLMSMDDFSSLSYLSPFHTMGMRSLFDSRVDSDVTIVCQNGEEVDAHRCLLIAAPYFATLVTGHNSETGRIKVDQDYNSIKLIVLYLYTGELHVVNVKSWTNFYKASVFFGLKGLANHCELQLMVRTDKDIECIKNRLHFAIEFNALKLKRFLIRLARKIQDTS